MGEVCTGALDIISRGDGFMKVAIVHDWLVTNAGSEKVLQALLELYKDADIYSLVDFLNDTDRKHVLHGKYAITSFVQKLPYAKNHFRNYLPLFPKAIESFDLSEYDLIISSSWAVAKGVRKHKNQIHISYCYTPIRYAWDLYDEYTKDLKQPKKFLVEQTLKYIRRWDIETIDRVDYFVADSKFVQERIKRTYGREAQVIYPPVDTEKFYLHREKEAFYVTASRLVPYKKTKLIVEAFNAMPDKKLVVIGGGEELRGIRQMAKDNIDVLGFQPDSVLIQTMQKAKAFVYAAIEDFGIIPIEAMACGTPVIALNDGGTAETVIDGVNGVHFQNQTVEDIVRAVKKLEQLTFDPLQVRKEALKYTHFKEQFYKYVSEKI